jgi:hypothetical protein
LGLWFYNLTNAPNGMAATNYYDDLFSRLIGDGVPLPAVIERVAGAYLDGKPLPLGKTMCCSASVSIRPAESTNSRRDCGSHSSPAIRCDRLCITLGRRQERCVVSGYSKRTDFDGIGKVSW